MVRRLLPQWFLRWAFRTKTALKLANARRHRLVIFDDTFPDPVSGFRMAEFGAYLQQIPGSAVYSHFNAPWSDRESILEPLREKYADKHPAEASRIHAFDPVVIPQTILVYCLFLRHAYDIIGICERHGIPLVFTLYPGGDFCLGQPHSDQRLRRVFSSPALAQVITTQKATRDYLLSQGYCTPARITHLFGGVARPLAGFAHRSPLTSDGRIRVCFVAYKYVAQGRDKGYDVFVEVAKRLVTTCEYVDFHVVGNFDETDVDVAGLGDRITFHGTQTSEFFGSFYESMDIIVSPNAPDILQPGAFDGFPTGCCCEAGMAGVAVFCTDPLELNTDFVDREELVIIPRNPKNIASVLSSYLEEPERLERLQHNGRAAFQRTFSDDRQIVPRVRLLEELIAEHS